MDGSTRADIESSDIITRIIKELEEVIGLIHRPSRREGSVAPFLVPAEVLAEPSAIPGAEAA